MEQKPFSEWMEILKDVTVIEHVAKTLSEGQRTDVIASIMNASTPDTRRRMVSWIHDKYGTPAIMRELVSKLRTHQRGTKKNP